ncbi:MAG: tetratricopeptide repeat protein [Bryobacteraceae bacterium]
MGPAAILLLLLQGADYYAEGMKALEAQKYAEAEQLFAKAAAADPKDYAAHFHLALSLTMLKRDAEAIAEYQKVLEMKPALYEAELNLGILLIRQKRAAEAVPYLQHASETKPKEYRPRYYFGEALLGSGDAQRAAAEFQAALELDPRQPAAELGLAQALARRNLLAEAAPHFRKAAELDPAYRDALLELGELYEKNKQIPEAVAIYQQFPQNVAVQERLGQLMLDAKRYSEAIPRLEEAFKKDPTPGNRAALAAAYLFDKQLERALPLLQQSAAAEPANYDVRMMYARALRDARQYLPAAEQFHAAIKLKPDSREAWNNLAAMLYLTERYPQVLAALDQALKLGEDTPANHYLRAITLDKLRAFKPALESYRKFLAMSQGKNPEEEFKARQRVRVLEKELSKR